MNIILKTVIKILIMLFFACVCYSKTQVDISCDKMNTVFQDSEAYMTFLEGNIQITTNDYVISAENGVINHTTNIIQLDNNVHVKHKDFSSISDSGKFDYKNQTASMENNVHITLNDYTINADKTFLNNKTHILDIDGNVSSKSKDYLINSVSMQINTKTEEMSSTDSYLCLEPAFTKGFLDENLYIKIKQINKGNTDKKYNFFDCNISGCNEINQHYHLFAKEMDIITDKRIIFNFVSLYYHKNKIISLDKYVIPLDPRYNDERAFPKIGFSTQEGYYAKFFYPYNPKSDDFYGRFLIDAMSKKGIGLGINQEYNFKFDKDYYIKGDFTYYKQFQLNNGKGDEEYNINHLHKIGKGKFDFRLDGNTTYYDGQEDYKYYNFSPSFTYTTEKTNSNIIYKRTKTTTSYSSISDYLTFNQDINFNRNYAFNLNVNYNKYSTDSYITKKLSTSTNLRGRETLLDWNVFAQFYDDLGDSKYSSLGMEKKPEITLSSDFSRLNLLKKGPFNVQLNTSYSKLTLTNGDNTDRLYLDMYMPGYTLSLTDNLDFDIDGRYRQYYYKSDMAKYALSSSPSFKYKFNDYNTLSIDYNFQNPNGYTPVSSDSLSAYRYSNFKWAYDNKNNLNMELYSGYDFMQKGAPWQNLYYKVKWKANNNFSSYLSTYYDLNERYFGTLIGQFKYVNKNNSMELGARYNGKTGKLTSAKGLLSLNLIGDYWFKGYLSWDGSEKEFDYIATELMRKHHCYDTSLVFKKQTGYYKDTSLMFYIKFNLFPDTDEFKSGQNGEAITADVGNLYY